MPWPTLVVAALCVAWSVWSARRARNLARRGRESDAWHKEQLVALKAATHHTTRLHYADQIAASADQFARAVRREVRWHKRVAEPVLILLSLALLGTVAWEVAGRP